MVSDEAREQGPADLEMQAALTDFVLVVSAPLAAGSRSRRASAGRAALARIADGRVDFSGSLGLGRKLLRLLTVSPVR